MPQKTAKTSFNFGNITGSFDTFPYGVVEADGDILEVIVTFKAYDLREDVPLLTVDIDRIGVGENLESFMKEDMRIVAGPYEANDAFYVDEKTFQNSCEVIKKLMQGVSQTYKEEGELLQEDYDIFDSIEDILETKFPFADSNYVPIDFPAWYEISGKNVDETSAPQNLLRQIQDLLDDAKESGYVVRQTAEFVLKNMF